MGTIVEISYCQNYFSVYMCCKSSDWPYFDEIMKDDVKHVISS